MARYFTSDLHFGHEPVIEYCQRPFIEVQDMNENLLANINKVVRKEDILYILGDFSFLPKDQNVKLVKSIICPVVLIRGNHDHSNRIKGCGFADVFDELDLIIDSNVVTLSHYPYRGDHTVIERYLDRRPKDVGQWLLHGHTHSKEKINRAERMIHVGVEAWQYRPIHEDDVFRMMNSDQ